jgi:hypothetical protein
MDASSLFKTFLLLLLSTSMFVASAEGATLSDVLSHIQANRNASDFKATGRIVQIEGLQRKTYQFSMRAKTISGVFKLFCEITDPAPSRIRLLLQSFPDGHSLVRAAHVSDHVPSDLSPEQDLLGTNFSLEDLFESQFMWKNQKLLEESMYGTRPSVVLKSQPSPSDKTTYSSVTSWLDKNIYYPLKEEKVIKASGATKEYIFYGLRESQSVWSATQIECKTKGKPGSTLLIISRGSEKAHLDESAFSPALLVRR